MTIYDFVNTITDCEMIVFKIFDFNSEDCVAVLTDNGDWRAELNIDEVLSSEYSDYEVCGVDIWIDKNRIYIEFNIEIYEEDE